MDSLLLAAGITLSITLIPVTIDKYSNTKFFCKKLGWHKAPETQGFDGCSANGTCPRCDKKVMQDSQGNWF